MNPLDLSLRNFSRIHNFLFSKILLLRKKKISKSVVTPIVFERYDSDTLKKFFCELSHLANEGLTWGNLKGWMISNNVTEMELSLWLQKQTSLDWILLLQITNLKEVVTRGVFKEAIDRTIICFLGNSKNNTSGQKIEGFFTSTVPSCHNAWHNKGRILLDSGNYEEALFAYKKALEFDNSAYITKMYIGATLYHLSDYEQALVFLNEVLEIKSDSLLCWFYKASIYFHIGSFRESIKFCNSGLKIAPNNGLLLFQKAMSLAMLNSFSKSLYYYDQVIKHDSKNYEAWHNRGVIFYSMGQNRKALESFKAATFSKKGHLSHFVMSEILEIFEETDKSLEEYQKAKKECPLAYPEGEDFRLQVTTVRQYLNILNDKNNEELSRFLITKEFNFKISKLSFDELIRKFEKHFEYGCFSSAFKILLYCRMIEPSSHQVYYYMGNTIAKLGFYEQAKDCYDKALSLYSEHQESLLARCKILLKLNLYSEVIISCDKLLQINSHCTEAWEVGSVALMKCGNYTESLRYSEKLLNLNPKKQEALLNKCSSLIELNQYEKATFLYKKSEDICRHSPRFWLEYGVALIKSGDMDEGLLSYQKALKLDIEYCKFWLQNTYLSTENKADEFALLYCVMGDFYFLRGRSTKSISPNSIEKSKKSQELIETGLSFNSLMHLY